MVYIHTTFLNYLNNIDVLSNEVLHSQNNIHVQIFTDIKHVLHVIVTFIMCCHAFFC